MFVQPLPGVHVHQGHAHDFVSAPEDIQGGIVVYFLVEAQELQVPFLEDERQSLGKGRVRYAAQHVMVDGVQIQRLFHIVAELMHGNVVAFVVHALFPDAGTQTGGFPAALRPPGMSRATGVVHHDTVGNVFGIFRAEAQIPQNARHIGGKSIRVRVFGAGQLGQFVFRHRGTALETVIPDIVRPQIPAQARFNQFGHLFYLFGGNHPDEQFLDILRRYFHALFEIAGNPRGQCRAVAVYLLFNMEHIQDMAIAGRTFRWEVHFLAILVGLVGIRCPVVGWVIDHFGRDALIHNPQHHLVDHLLFFLRVGNIGVVRFEFVAEVPVREQHHVFGEKAAAVIGQQVAHHDVVRSYVAFRFAQYLGLLGLDFSRDTGRELVSHPGVGPFQAIPVLP